jgi:hypothetical protein
VKLNINLIEVHPQLNINGHPKDGALIGVNSMWPMLKALYGIKSEVFAFTNVTFFIFYFGKVCLHGCYTFLKLVINFISSKASSTTLSTYTRQKHARFLCVGLMP